MRFGGFRLRYGPGGPGCYHHGAPTDPDVPALGHPVPRTNSFAILTVPEAIQSSDVDMR